MQKLPWAVRVLAKSEKCKREQKNEAKVASFCDKYGRFSGANDE